LIVCIESPFKPSDADIAKYEGRYSQAELLRQNLVYARLALLSSLMRGEAPVASHLLYTQVWSEKPELRANGIKAGIELHYRVDLVCLYVDLGVSKGMKDAEAHAELVSCERGRRSILDVTDGKDAREFLAKQELGGFPYLDELTATEQGSLGRIKTGKIGA
jgi:hypothetical protein